MRWKLLFVAGMLFSILLVGVDIGSATTAGPNSPGTMADDATVGTETWSNVDNAKVSDNVYALVTGLDPENTSGAPWDKYVRIVKSNGNLGTENKAQEDWSHIEKYVSYGGSSDLWSETWTSEDINNVNFGVVVSAWYILTSHYLKATNFSFTIPTGATINGILVEIEKKRSGTDATANVDHIRITVYYTAGEPPPSTCWHVEDGLCWLPPNCNVTFSDFLGACFT
jgi:hypothetical protein